MCYVFGNTWRYVHICNSVIDCLRATLSEHVTSMFKLSPTCCSDDDDNGQSDTHEELQSSQVAQEATLKPGLADGSPSSFSHSHSPRIFSRWTIPSLSDDASPLLQSLSFSLSPPFFPFSLSASSFDLSFCSTSVPLLQCVVAQALRVLCIPQTQCHPFILHQGTLTPIIWRVHKAAQPHDPKDEGRIETDGQRSGRKMERDRWGETWDLVWVEEGLVKFWGNDKLYWTGTST